MKISSRWKAWRRLSKRERLLFMESFAYLGAARLTIWSLSYARLKRMLHRKKSSTIEATEAQLQAMNHAIERAARITPWPSLCLDQAVAGRWMLLRRGLPADIHIGVRKNEAGEVLSHAWLVCGSWVVTGDEGLDQFKVITTLGEG